MKPLKSRNESEIDLIQKIIPMSSKNSHKEFKNQTNMHFRFHGKSKRVDNGNMSNLDYLNCQSNINKKVDKLRVTTSHLRDHQATPTSFFNDPTVLKNYIERHIEGMKSTADPENQNKIVPIRKIMSNQQTYRRPMSNQSSKYPTRNEIQDLKQGAPIKVFKKSFDKARYVSSRMNSNILKINPTSSNKLPTEQQMTHQVEGVDQKVITRKPESVNQGARGSKLPKPQSVKAYRLTAGSSIESDVSENLKPNSRLNSRSISKSKNTSQSKNLKNDGN